MSNTDELFASLGGSLMKDLWADLNVDGDEEGIGWSLEQLERELAHLDDEPPPLNLSNDPPGLSAANLVVSHAQDFILPSSFQPPQQQTPSNTSADAWSQSLANFSSLEQDFLAADSARKSSNGKITSALLAQAEDYNVTEKLQAPPGMIISPPITSRQLFSNATPQNSMAQLPVDDLPSKSDEDLPIIREEMDTEHVPPMPKMVPPTPHSSLAFPHIIMPPQQMMAPPPPMPATPGPMQVWQTRPQPPPLKIFANVHPSAPPIPAAALESSLMKSRDLAYVIHAMLKPVLMMGTSPNDYHMKLLQRQVGVAAAAAAANTTVAPNKESLDTIMTLRAQKTAEWKDSHKILGSTTKTDVTRPRALLATPPMNAVVEEGGSFASRAALWKARLNIDQGYQAMATLVDLWQHQAPPLEIQTQLLKLLKCLGMSIKDGVYSIEGDKALSFVLNMTKGKIFVARLLEQALLPPKAVVVLLPCALEASMTTSTMADERLFAGYARVLSTIQLQDSTLLECLEKVSNQNALQSQARMECVHALLRGGSVRAAQDPAGFGKQWNDAEAAFMKLLS